MNNIPKKFVGLHAHSCASIGDAISRGEEHINFAIENGMDAIASTDHGNCNGFPEYYLHTKELKKKGQSFKYLPGNEMYFIPDLEQWRKDKSLIEEQKKLDKKESSNESEDDGTVIENEEESKSSYNDILRRRHHLVLLAKSTKGLENIFTLTSRSYKEGFYRFPRIDFKMLREHGEDVVALSACVAGRSSWLIAQQYGFDPKIDEINENDSRWNKAINDVHDYYETLKECLGEENVFGEIQFNKLNLQTATNKILLHLAKEKNLKLVATADSHYCRPDYWQSREMYKLLSRLRGNVDPSMLPQHIEDLKCELYPKNAEQMWQSYKKYGAEYNFYDDSLIKDAIERTYDIAHDLIGNVEIDCGMKLPSSIVPQGMTAFNALLEKCKEGMKIKGLDKKPEYVQRLFDELKVIKQKGFSEYFLTMKVIFDIAEKETLAGAGRGSAAGSLINYVLDITKVDPLKYELLFSRFINAARNDPPDVDCIDSRHKIVMADNTLKTISNVREGERVLDIFGKQQKVLCITKRELKADDVIYEIIVKNNEKYGSIICNHKHRLFLSDSSIIEAKNLAIGQFLFPNFEIISIASLQERISLVDITVENTSSFRIIPFSSIVEKKDKKTIVYTTKSYKINATEL